MEMFQMSSEGESEKHSARVKIINERLVETSLTCTCDYQPWACQACDFDRFELKAELSEREAVIRKRFKASSVEESEGERRNDSEDNLKTSDYDPHNGWLERDPETTQTFKRKQQKAGLFSVSWRSNDAPDLISREEAWKLYIQKLQDEANYLLNSPDNTDICCCKDCIFEYELACNEVLGWKRRSTTVEGFTKEVNTFCDPSAFSVIHNIVQDKYRALPCSIM